MKHITKQEALLSFREAWKAETKGSRFYYDTIAKREAFNNYTDSLCKEGKITLKQYETWGNPF
tara:strand:- start:115 stop:303 length:189 start_codon:yes stop_codon:yes gene_type:complete